MNDFLNIFIPWFAFVCFLFLMAYILSDTFRFYISNLFQEKENDDEIKDDPFGDHHNYYGDHP